MFGHHPLVVYLCVSVSADMLPYCSVHDKWLIMKLLHTANNVSSFSMSGTYSANKVSSFSMSGTILPTMCPILVVIQ